MPADEAERSRIRAAISKLGDEETEQGVLTCKGRLVEVKALLEAKMQALGQMDANGDRHASRRIVIHQEISALSDQQANLEWHLDEYNQRLQLSSKPADAAEAQEQKSTAPSQNSLKNRWPEPIHYTSSPPKPISPLRGSWKRPAPRYTQPIPDLPPTIPNDLKPATEVIIGGAVKKFPIQTQILQLCKYVISELTQYLCSAIQTKALRADLALDAMKDLVRLLIVYNCDSSQQFQLQQDARQSDEWLRFAGEVEKCAAPVPSSDGRTVSGPLLKKYRSELKRFILIQLSQNPDAKDLGVCRGLDADGGIELPWKSKPADRSFEDAYRDPHRRKHIHTVISKVRRDLRSKGLLASR